MKRNKIVTAGVIAGFVLAGTGLLYGQKQEKKKEALLSGEPGILRQHDIEEKLSTPSEETPPTEAPVTTVPSVSPALSPTPAESLTPEVSPVPQPPPAAPPFSKQEIDLSLEPSNIRLTGKAGESKESAVRVYNNGTKAMSVNIEISDMVNRTDAQGLLERVYVPPGTVETSLARWILISEKEFVLEPRSMREVKFVVSPPAGTKGVLAAVVFFRSSGVIEAKTPVKGKPSSTVMIQPRLGVLVFYEAEGSVARSGKLIGEMKFEPPSQGSPFRISYTFENTGNADILLTGNFHILDSQGALTANESLSPLRTFPGDKGSTQTEWPGDLDPGDYHLIVSLELGPDAQEVIVKEYDFTVT